MAWFRCVSELVETLFLGSHVGPGGVARGTEMQTLSMENTEACHRNVFIMHGYLVAALRYNKSQHNNQMDKLIARFIPSRFGRIFLYYAVLVRCLERIWAEDVFGALKSISYKHLVFVCNATPMETSQFSKVLFDSTLEFLHVGLGIHDYRQFIKAVLRVILGINYDKGEDDQIDVTDASFGHSSDIGTSFYGLSSTDLPNLTSDLLRLHQRYCQQVHRWLEGKSLHEGSDAPNMAQMATMLNDVKTLVEDIVQHKPSQEFIASTVRKVAIDVIKESIQNTLNPAIQHSIRTEIHNTLSSSLRVDPAIPATITHGLSQDPQL
jgi:hypothetical protein